jgi:hypothetical protein
VFFDFGSRGSASMRASHGSWISGDDASALFQMLKDKGEGVLTRAHHKFSHRVLVVDDVRVDERPPDL